MAKHEKFRFKSAEELVAKATTLGVELPWSENLSALFKPAQIGKIAVPNRLAVQPMEGFDSDDSGSPSELAFRRYGRYAAGGSGMIWFEATSVLHEGRSNPRQMMITEDNVHKYKKLTDHVRQVARETFGPTHRPFLVLQLTHSGRYSKPYDGFTPKIFSNNPYLVNQEHLSVPRKKEPLENITPNRFTDSDLDAIKSAYIQGVYLAEEAGFDAVDVKACHGYLLHELLYAFDRTDSRYGGSFENRTRFLRDVLQTKSNIRMAVRLSAFDLIPHPYGFGMKPDGSNDIELTEVERLVGEFAGVVPLWNITAGVPRIAPHVGRPYDRGAFNGPPPDEHPLQGISRLIRITGSLQQKFPALSFVGTGYSWLRNYYPYVGSAVIDRNLATFIGLGRSSFAYPDSPADLMQKGAMDPKKVCIACSKCTEFMRLGVPAGCGVRDQQYKGNSVN